MAKRGFFAELQHQSAVAARERERAAKAAARQHAAAVRQAEAAQRKAVQAQAQAARAAAADQKRAEAEAKQLHLEARQAEVESLNAQLASDYDQIDSLLGATLDVDDYVDLELLRSVATHPPFERIDLEQPLLPPPPVQPPPEPQWVEPPAPTGLGGMLGGKKKHEEARAKAWEIFTSQQRSWQEAAAHVPTLQFQQMQAHQQAEQQREAALAQARAAYASECAERESAAAAANQALDELIAGLEAGKAEAVLEYISIVLENSVYPDLLPIEHDFDFDAELRELDLKVTIPGPDELPKIKAYRYAKGTDEIMSTDLPAKAQKDRYASLLHQITLRSVHEVFEADRVGCIQTISLAVGTDSIDPATGQLKSTPLAAVATDRAAFEAIDLSLVVPAATLEHLGALVSKNPHGLVAIDTSKGVRSS